MKKTNRLLSGVIAFAIVLGMFVMPLNAAAGPATLQPAEGERIPVLTGKDDNGPGVGGFVQKPRFTENVDGTYSVVTGHDGWYASWTDDKYSEGQWTNQDNGSAQWNYYFPRVYYPEGVKAVELAWGLMSLSDAADLADYEIYYSSDAVAWTKTTAFTTYLYTPFIYHQEGNGYVIDFRELGSSNGSSVGVRFVFDEAIEAKYFFAYDPNPAFGNIQHWCGYFVACEAPAVELPEIVASYTGKTDSGVAHLYLNALVKASETRDVGILFASSADDCKLVADDGYPLFARVCTKYSALLQSGCYSEDGQGVTITPAHLGGVDGDSIIAVYWQDLPASYGTIYARTFAKNSDGSFSYGEIATITFTSTGALPLGE